VKSGLIGLLIFVAAGAMMRLGWFTTPGNVAMRKEFSRGFVMRFRKRVIE
jgi:hypothetical protein